MDSSGSLQGPVPGCSEQGKESSDPTKSEEFLDQLSDYLNLMIMFQGINLLVNRIRKSV
jgi:hypothetical protein